MPPEQSVPAAETALEYEFGPFRLDAARRALYRGSDFIALTPKAAEMLLLLVEEAGRVVTKEQILERAWPGVVIEEGAIANNVSTLRKALDGAFGDEGAIATVPRRGYRFTAEVRTLAGALPPSPAPTFISERDTILVADIENRTGDPVFDGTIRQALLLHLAQSPFLEILTDRKVLTVLGYMGQPGAPIAGDIALEVCQRTGSRAAITGSIFALGDDYVIGLQALQGESGDMLVTEQARAHGKSEVLKALDTAAIGLRNKLGESLGSIKQFSRPFDEVATASLDALKAYSMGRVQWLTRGEAAGKPHMLRAIELDPEFASAYSALSHMCANMGQTQEARYYMQKAYDLRERVTERERVRTIASYHSNVTGDLFKSLDAHRAWEITYPRDASAVGNAGNVLSMLGQWEKALAYAQRGLAIEPTNISASNLAIALMALGRHDEARAILEDAFARGLDAFYLHLDAYQEAFLRGDAGAMSRHSNAVAGHASEEDFLLAAQADTEAYFGHFARARELSERAAESAREAGVLEMAAMWKAQAALREAEIGNLAAARDGAAAALEIARGQNVDSVAALALARGGESGRAAQLLEELDREYPKSTVTQRYWLPSIRAALALRRDSWKAAVDALDEAAAVEFGITLPFEGGFMIPTYLRGVALLGAGRASDAAAEFAKIIERPGLIKNFVLFPLALLQASRALKLDGRKDEAGAMRQRFDEIWKTADVSPGG
jgi:DNA-binding winged helix-turn-helix (wHTH) protein/tetratricopeptide (TPR) repeat protein